MDSTKKMCCILLLRAFKQVKQVVYSICVTMKRNGNGLLCKISMSDLGATTSAKVFHEYILTYTV